MLPRADVLRGHRSARLLARRFRTAFWKAIYRLPEVDATFLLSSGCRIERDFVAGAYGFMNRRCSVCTNVSVGKYVMFGPDVSIVGADHRFDRPGTPMIFSGRPEVPPTVIEDDVWLGARSVVIAGTRIGRGTIIAAGAVVTKNVPEYSICAGVPARIVRARFDIGEQTTHDEMLRAPAAEGDYCDPK